VFSRQGWDWQGSKYLRKHIKARGTRRALLSLRKGVAQKRTGRSKVETNQGKLYLATRKGGGNCMRKKKKERKTCQSKGRLKGEKKER